MVFCDVLGNVFLRVVGPHLLLIDVLLKDVTQNVGVDLVVGPQRAFVEMPLVAIEVIKEFLERLIGNRDICVLLLQLVNIEQAAVEVRHGTQQSVEFSRRVGSGALSPSWKSRRRKWR